MIQNLGKQVTKLASQVSKMVNNSSGKLPVQPEVNFKANVSAIQSDGVAAPNFVLESFSSLDIDKKFSSNSNKVVSFPSSCDLFIDTASCGSSRMVFPPTSRLTGEQNELEAFRKVEVNILMLEAMSQIPSYVEFLKIQCKNQVHSSGTEEVSENVCMLLSNDLPEKCLDPDMFTLPCMIGSNKIKRVMLDLGASINVMPVSLYRELGLTNLRSSGIVIQFAGHSCIKP